MGDALILLASAITISTQNSYVGLSSMSHFYKVISLLTNMCKVMILPHQNAIEDNDTWLDTLPQHHLLIF